ncbi:MAG: glycoside hydrolase, partial [Thermoguttaceae bacterium]|nr:glycoside hydrolase [Thermoguttaceae bacterium]
TTIRISFDEGETWCAPVTVDHCLGAYPSMVTLRDGSTLIVYYEEKEGSNIRARKFRISNGGVEWLKFDR